ncbi:hypothetical protein GCM10027261_44740 [Geodermatophilus arenarius]
MRIDAACASGLTGSVPMYASAYHQPMSLEPANDAGSVTARSTTAAANRSVRVSSSAVRKPP